MSPTINHTQSLSIVIVDRVTPRLGWYTPVKGDVVEFTRPGSCCKRVVKRVVGVGGDVVRPRGVLSEWRELGQDVFWAEGDNEVTSLDSNEYGPVNVSSIVGRCMFTLSLFEIISLERKDLGGERVRRGHFLS